MKLKISPLLLGALLAPVFLFSSLGTAKTQTILIDFGNGLNPTTSPDINGNTWNNLTSPSAGTIANLLTTGSTSSGISVSVTDAFENTGPGTYVPLTGTPALGNLNISTAISDNFYVVPGNAGQLTFGGLDPTKTYTFTLFGTRDLSGPYTTAYLVTGLDSGNATLQTSGANLGGPGINYNNSSVATISSITPNGSNAITLAVSTASGFGYLSALQVTVVPEPGTSALLLGGFALLALRRGRGRAR